MPNHDQKWKVKFLDGHDQNRTSEKFKRMGKRKKKKPRSPLQKKKNREKLTSLPRSNKTRAQIEYDYFVDFFLDSCLRVY